MTTRARMNLCARAGARIRAQAHARALAHSPAHAPTHAQAHDHTYTRTRLPHARVRKRMRIHVCIMCACAGNGQGHLGGARERVRARIRTRARAHRRAHACMGAPAQARAHPTLERRSATHKALARLPTLLRAAGGAPAQHNKILGSIVVSISACHAEGPGSIPGRGAHTQTKQKK